MGSAGRRRPALLSTERDALRPHCFQVGYRSLDDTSDRAVAGLGAVVHATGVFAKEGRVKAPDQVADENRTSVSETVALSLACPPPEIGQRSGELEEKGASGENGQLPRSGKTRRNRKEGLELSGPPCVRSGRGSCPAGTARGLELPGALAQALETGELDGS